MSITVYKENFSLHQIALSGQCFRLEETSDGVFSLIARDKYLRLYQESGSEKVIFDCEQEEYDAFWADYFDLNTDYHSFICAADNKDKYLWDAIRFGSGIRILRQDLWEMIVSFLISQQNNIKRIRRCIDNISAKYGEKCTNKYGESYFAFPEAEALSTLDEDALMECNLGYRSKYVVRTAKMICSGEVDLDYIASLDYAKARAELLKLYGVGVKVADCICLFALHHLDAFPIDTHIKQMLAAHYPDGFDFERYRGFAGVMQQYIFYYELFK